MMSEPTSTSPREDVRSKHTGQQRKQSSGNPHLLKRRSKKKSKSTTPKPSQFSVEDAEQRDNEINQCFNLLSNKGFKLFKRGASVTSFGLNLDVRLPEKVVVKFILNVPHAYPQSPLQLQWKKNASEDNLAREVKLQTLVRNFNFKSREMSLQKTPIIAQLNYLVYKAEILAVPGYKLIDRREREFYAIFA